MNINYSVSFKYDTILKTTSTGVSYGIDDNGNQVVYINHKLNKKYPNYTIVEDATGSVIIPHVRFTDANNAEFTFLVNSTGTITLS